MAEEVFVRRNFSDGSLDLIRKANRIIADYQAQGLTLTLRQLYYQFVTKNWIRNKQSEYKRLGSVINDARLAGMIDWEAIEDRVRNLRSIPNYASGREFLDKAPNWFAFDLWDNQETRVEVWIEKDALVGVIQGPCNRRRVPYFASRGYNSQSEQYRAGKRFADYIARGQRVVVLHLGDHDPSGIDMTRDNDERLGLFVGPDYFDQVEFRRIALNYEQVEAYNPPPNPAKFTDSRCTGYVKKYGQSCWELDALEPSVIVNLVNSEIDDLIDPDKWNEALQREHDMEERLRKFFKGWKEPKE